MSGYDGGLVGRVTEMLKLTKFSYAYTLPVPIQFNYGAKMIGLAKFSEKSVGGCTTYDVIAP